VKIGLVSDTHGSVKTFQKVLSGPFQRVDLILHAGDILYHGARNPLAEGYDTSGLAALINELRIPALIAKGNCDSDVDQFVLDIPSCLPMCLLM